MKKNMIKKHFEQACRDRSIRLFMTPPRSPKLQCYVERSNRTYREEFYEVEDIAIRLDEYIQQSRTPGAVKSRILELRERYPRWRKEKLTVLLEREGIHLSGSTVGRVMTRLRERALLVEPENMRQAKLVRRRRRKPRYAVRKPKGYKVEAPGDLVQVDTLQVRLVANEVRFQFSAWDMAAKYCAFRAYRRQTSTAAADFLHHLKTKFPFPIKAIQIDGGSEFKDQFEEACRSLEITLFVNPPKCPEMNGGVERTNRNGAKKFRSERKKMRIYQSRDSNF